MGVLIVMAIKKSSEDFKKEILKINKDILVIREYQNNRTKVSVKCKKNGKQWDTSPKILIRGSGCPICARRRRKKWRT